MRLAETQGFRSAIQPAVFAGTGNVDIGRWLSAGWAMVSADLGTWILAALLMIVLTIVTCGLGGPAMACGLYLIAFRKLAGRPAAATDVTLGFGRFLNALGVAFLLGIPTFLVVAVREGVQFAMQLGMRTSNGEPNMGMMGLLVVFMLGMQILQWIAGSAAATVGFFSVAHVAARNAGPIEAIRESWTVVRRNPWMFLLTAILFQIISGAGVIALCVGILVTVPLIAAATAQAYVDHFGLDDAAVG
jgi:uncharacterized membrane protein